MKDIENELVPRLSVRGPQEWVESLELRNLLLLAEVEAEVCLRREESRGPHFREDFPKQDDLNWLKCITARKVGDRLHLGTAVLDATWKNRGDEQVKMWG